MMLVAVIDQSAGTSTSRCSKMELPLVSVMEAVRRSHCTWSYGERPFTEKRREKARPCCVEGAYAWSRSEEVCRWVSLMESSWSAILAKTPRNPAQNRPEEKAGNANTKSTG